MLRLLASVVSLVLLGCHQNAPELCEGPHWSIEVQVQDSVSGAWIGSGATLIVSDGVYADTSYFPPGAFADSVAIGAGDSRPGLYLVTVRRSGYLDWRRDNVRVVE